MEKNTVFGILMNELGQAADATSLLEESMSLNTDRIRKVPLRFKVIAYGFLKHLTLEELNEKLLENGCARLYARSLYDASLIYAFRNGAPYERWKELYTVAERFAREQASPYFNERSVHFSELERYVLENSDAYGRTLHTATLTRQMEQRIVDAAAGQLDFESFLRENFRAFSQVREKSRYYFCKYLYYNLSQRIETYLQAVPQDEEAFSILQPFKGIQELRRKKHTQEEVRAFLHKTELSCGGIFDAFNEMFFEYISSDWITVLSEAFGTLLDLPEKDRHRIAASFRRQDPKTYASLSDSEILQRKQKEIDRREEDLDEAFALEGGSRGYQKNRSGENAVRNYIKGTLDLDRTTLVCFLLFFGKDTSFSEDLAITEARLNAILSACGFPVLRPEVEFDSFVLGYLDSDDPVDFLMQQVTNFALEEENFYLYRVYNLSTSYQKEMEKMAGGGK